MADQRKNAGMEGRRSVAASAMLRHRLRRGFTLLEMLYWLTYGSFTTYLVSFVTATRGANASTAGLMLAIFMASACAGQFVIGGLCDRRQNNRSVFVVGMAATIMLEMAVYFSPNMLLLGVGCVFLGFIQPPTGAILDTWLIRSFPDEPGAYSPIRSLGSLSYAALMVIMGMTIHRFGHTVMPVFSTVFAVLAITVALKMPEIPRVSGKQAAERRAGLGQLPRVVWLFVLSLAIMGMATTPLINMNLLILENVGGTVASMGIATSFNTLAEFIVMRFPKPYMRFGARQRLLRAGALYVGSTVLMVFSGTVWMLYLATFVNGMAYGVLLPARRQYVTEIAPAQTHNRVHGLGDMAYLNFGGLVGNQVSGLLIDSRGVRFMLVVSLCVQTVAMFVLSTLKHAMRRDGIASETNGES